MPAEVDISDLDGSMVSMTTGGTFTAYLTSELTRIRKMTLSSFISQTRVLCSTLAMVYRI